MPGLIVHVLAGLFSAIIVHLIHFRLAYSAAIFIGNLLPDIIKFGGAAIKQATLNVFSIKQDSLYHTLDAIAYSPENWFTLGFFVFAVALFLFHFHYIRKKTMEEYDLLYVCLLIGVFMHLVMDVFIHETGPWI
jgi:hypothetical protein